MLPNLLATKDMATIRFYVIMLAHGQGNDNKAGIPVTEAMQHAIG
jgi:hypothetical protein